MIGLRGLIRAIVYLCLFCYFVKEVTLSYMRLGEEKVSITTAEVESALCLIKAQVCIYGAFRS